MNKCETCSHKEVCSLKDDYAEFAGKVEKINADVKTIPSSFRASVECKHYSGGSFSDYQRILEITKQQQYQGGAKVSKYMKNGG